MTLEGIELRYRLGDTWHSPVWAVMIDDQAVNLIDDGWTVLCQARRTSRLPPIHEWTVENGGVVVGEADVAWGDSTESGVTSTIQLINSAVETEYWDPFAAEFEIEIQRGSGDEIERYTIVSGRMYALQDIADD